MNLGEITHEDIAAYHARDAVGHSKLETFRDPDRGPARFFGQYIAKTIRGFEGSAATDFGQALDSLVLEKKRVFKPHPTTYVGVDAKTKREVVKPWRWGANVTDEWREQNKDFIILSPFSEDKESAPNVESCNLAVQANPVAATLLSRGEPQLSFRYNFGPFRVQVRPDWWNKDGITLPDGTTLPPYIVDLKSAEDMDQFLKNRRALGYSRQAALYREIVRMVMANIGGMPLDEVIAPDFLFAVVFKSAPVECVIFRESDEEIAEATNEVIDDLRRLKKCYAENVWLGSPRGITTLPAIYRKAARDAFTQLHNRDSGLTEHR